ncbi:hypothetical protein TNCV_1419291 [Trichonephila clavipes]|nr:hypothetical protein TNCV_1419291 [Trichonephila clavipes]
MMIEVISLSIVSTGISYPSDFKWPQRKKSKKMRFRKYGGQRIGLPRLIHLPGYLALEWLRSAIEKWAGAPLCMNHRFWCAVVGALCSISKRSGKFTYEQVSSTLPRPPNNRIHLVPPLPVWLIVLPMTSIIAIFID